MLSRERLSNWGVKKWTADSWAQELQNEVKENWGGEPWGGREVCRGGCKKDPAAASEETALLETNSASMARPQEEPLVSESKNRQGSASEEQPVAKSEVRFGSLLGSGTYGRVYFCEYKGNNYAMKIPKDVAGSNLKEL
jgi:hypothetical protein